MDWTCNKDRQQDYLLMLIWHSIFYMMFAAATFLLGWEKNILVFLTTTNVACWALHFSSAFPEKYKAWAFFLNGMAMFFFYGEHSTSLWDMTAVYLFALLLYCRNRIRRMITIATAVYFFTLFFNFVFESRFGFELSPLNISRTILHCVLAYAAGRITKGFISRDLQKVADLDREIYALEEKNSRTIDFLSNVSHELRTPINVITGTSAISLKHEPGGDKNLNILFMQEAGNKLFSLVDEILDYAEISSGRVILFEEDYEFLSLANDIVSDSRSLPLGGNVEMIFNIDSGIPSMLSGDSKKIKKVMHLLIDNAVKFTRLGAVYIKMEALPKNYGVNLRFEVRDTGKGIGDKDIAKISSSFYQGNSGRNRSTGGLGLGLPIAYGLISSMNGFIQVESEPDKGTTFTVSIPQRVSDAAPSIALNGRLNVTAGLFIRPEKYVAPEVKMFYNETIQRMVKNLELPVHRVFDLAELKKLVEMYQLTHLFLGREEYSEDSEFFESLCGRMTVAVIADAMFSLPPESAIKTVKKPLWILPVLNVLDRSLSMDIAADRGTRMVCPGVKTLVVDDEPMNLMITEGLLKEYQMKISFAQSGREAIELFEKESFDIIFLDHMMPEMDGVETMRRLKMIASKSGVALRVVAFTANVISSARETFIKEGFSEFLSKPVEITELERVLKRVLPDTMISCAPAAEEEAGSPQEAGGLKALAAASLDTQAGLGYCGGDEAFYRGLLLKFAEDAPEKQAKIESLCKARDYENYRIQVHALKSTAKTIGAAALSEAARRLEDASKSKDGKYIEENHASAMRQYAETAEAIAAALGGGKAKAETPSGEAAGAPSLSRDELMRRLAELKKRVATFEAGKALEIIDGMAGMRYGGKPVADLLKGARQDIDDFDFSAAAEKLDGLISQG